MRLIIITGQTATGKTEKAIEFAKKYNGELVNCDSRQVYKKLDIITGKDIDKNFKFKISNLKFKNTFDIGFYSIPSTTNYQRPTTNDPHIKLWLYDIVDPKQHFSSFDYAECAEYVIKDILNRGKTPILVGGTGFYLIHLLYGVNTPFKEPDWKLRNELETKSVKELQMILMKRNKTVFTEMNNSDRNNPRRLIRRIEILQTNETLKPQNTKISLPKRLGFPELEIEVLCMLENRKEKREELISKRVEKRLESGAVSEVKNLLHEGYSPTDPGLNTIGYKQIIRYIDGDLSLDDAKREWIKKEVQYMKRQKTYMKKYFKIKNSKLKN